MNDRIKKLTELTMCGEMYVNTVKTEFDREDIFLSEPESDVKRLCEYILNQEPKITQYSALTGFFNFDGSVVGDAFRRGGHRFTRTVMEHFYRKPVDNISTMEYQHATADYKKLLNKGVSGIISDIEKSLEIHHEKEEIEFLQGVKKAGEALILWAYKCSQRVEEFSKSVTEEEYKENLKRLKEALLNVPEKAPSSFFEAILSIYICFSADPDSLGTLDRYLYPFYKKDLEEKKITRDEAKQYLQELFLMLQAATKVTSGNFTRGGESHFCIGGYLSDGSDCWSEISELIMESLMELPTHIPQVTLRWTKKTPRKVLRYMMNLERKDANKRIAFTNDEKRIKSYTQICGIDYEKAVGYTTVGCNEPAFLGAITGGSSAANLLRCVETLFHRKNHLIESTSSFDEFYDVFEKELSSELEIILNYDDKYNIERSKDINYVSSLFFNDCIENARSLTRGGGETVMASVLMMGITNVIDSLIVVKQFVFEDRIIEMRVLIDALKNNWNGFEDLRAHILKKGKFFGNDDELSNGVAQRLYESFYKLLYKKRNVFGYPILIGDLTGYVPHFKFFGEKTAATPDGRYDGDYMKFGIGQSEGKDREGLSALLNSISSVDPYGIACGSTVTNITVDEQMVKNDDNFEKMVDMFETYFKNGGVHFQLNYVSKEDLLKAKKTPGNYKNLRVRVSGFSDYFVKLAECMQDDVIERTSKR